MVDQGAGLEMAFCSLRSWWRCISRVLPVGLSLFVEFSDFVAVWIRGLSISPFGVLSVYKVWLLPLSRELVQLFRSVESTPTWGDLVA